MNLDDSNASTERVSCHRKMIAFIRRSLLNFDLFEASYNDAHGRRNEIVATRIYIVAMIIGLTGITFYASLVEYSVTYRVSKIIFMAIQRTAQTIYLDWITLLRSIPSISQSTSKFSM